MKIFRKFSERNINRIEKKALILITIIEAVVVLGIIVSRFDFSRLQVSFYSLKSYKVNAPIRVVMLSDLHLREFGEDNIELRNRVETLNPDIIAVVGDLTVYKNPDHEVAVSFLNKLSDIAPVYYSYGNHEYDEILFMDGSKLEGDLSHTKAQLLNRTNKKINVNGTDILLGGLCVDPGNFNDKYRKYMSDFCDENEFKILLCHHVELYKEAMNDFPVDLALTGHAHGGQIILPFIGPIYSPDQGLFPELTKGMHRISGSNVVISRGLGNSRLMPRYNNDPEIVVVDISNY